MVGYLVQTQHEPGALTAKARIPCRFIFLKARSGEENRGPFHLTMALRGRCVSFVSGLFIFSSDIKETAAAVGAEPGAWPRNAGNHWLSRTPRASLLNFSKQHFALHKKSPGFFSVAIM
jgi:hypothetical protein